MNNSLKKVGNLNDIPAEYLPKLPEMGEVLHYRFLNAYEAALMDGNVVRGSQTFYGSEEKLPPTSHFITKEGQRVDIGLATRTDKEGNATDFERIWFRPGETAGVIMLKFGEGITAKQFTYMELMSQNQANPYRDQDVRPRFERVDREAEAQAETDKELLETEAMVKAAGLSGAEQKIAALLHGVDPEQTETLVKRDLVRAAKKDPKAFLKNTSSKHAATAALLENAKRLGVATVDVPGKSLNWAKGGQQIIPVPNPTPDGVTEAFIRYSATKDGKLILEEMEKEVAATEKAVNAERAKAAKA